MVCYLPILPLLTTGAQYVDHNNIVNIFGTSYLIRKAVDALKQASPRKGGCNLKSQWMLILYF